MNEKKPGRNNRKRKLLTALCIFLALVLVIMLGLVIWGKTLLGRINRFDPNENTLSSSEMDDILNQTDPDVTGPVLNPDDVTLPTGPVDVIPTDENIINFLLVGQDRREGQGRQRSDSMILVTINKSAKTLTMTSFMRDVWLTIPGYRDQRLNVAYMIGGFDMLNATLEKNFGVSSDHNIEVDFSGFMKIIDSVGGVDIELTKAEAQYLNKRGNWEVDDDKSWKLKAGINHLTGSQALAYSRIRDIGDDFGRTNRQRTVLTALVDKAKTLSWLQLYPLINNILPLITTDMTDAEILGYVRDLLPILPELEIVSQRVPVDGNFSYANINNNSVILLREKDMKIALEMLKKTMSED